MKLPALLLAFAASAAMASSPEIRLQLGQGIQPLPATGLEIRSTPEGSDDLECLREGEWSVGQVVLRARAAAPDGETSLVLRIMGGSERAPIPALVRRGPVKQLDGQTPVRETYIRNAHRDGNDVVATVPFPLVPGMEDRYDLVDQSSSVDWLAKPKLDPDPRDREPVASRRPLILVPGDEEGEAGSGLSDARLDAFRVLRDAPAYRKLFATHKPYVFRYPAYRSAKDNAAALVRLIRTQFPGGGRVALIAHGSGADIMRQTAAASGIARRVSSAVTLAETTPAALFSSLGAP